MSKIDTFKQRLREFAYKEGEALDLNVKELIRIYGHEIIVLMRYSMSEPRVDAKLQIPLIEKETERFKALLDDEIDHYKVVYIDSED